MKHVKDICLNMTLLLALVLTAGCGSDSAGNGTAGTTTITGSSFASYVSGASLTVMDTNGNTVAGPVTTSGDGTFSVEIPNTALTGNLIFRSSGGTFDDESTGLKGKSAGVLAAYISGGTLSSGSAVHATPSSTIVHDLVVTHGKTVSEAESAFKAAFGYTPDVSVAPTDATTPAADATDAQKLAGLRAAAFSQLANNMGLLSTDQFDLFAALARDLSYGSLDGQDASGALFVAGTGLPEDMQNCFAKALLDFHGGVKNATGLNADKIGTIPFAKVAITDGDTYTVEYVPNMMGMMDMGAMEGKSTFSLRISDSIGDPVIGLTPMNLMLMPMMHMSTMNHGTPVDSIVDNGDGTYTCTVYYAMASAMSGGMSMGYWELKVMIGGMMGEAAFLYPSIMMDMSGDDVKAKLQGQADKIAGMGGMAMSRDYYIYNDGATQEMAGTHKVDLFIAAKESMMSFPAVSVSTILNEGDATYELTVSTMLVEVSTNGTDWVSATDAGGSHWTATGLTGLTTDEAGTVYVRLTINGEQKTTNGSAPADDGTNDYATITVTPGAMSM